MKKNFILLISILLSSFNLFAGTTGKISGTVSDKNTGEPLEGVNILVEGTTMGAATDLDGFYVILNVPPGEYTLQAVSIGYRTQTFTDVRVNIDQTTKIEFSLESEALTTDAVVVVAQRPVVEPDVATSRANIGIEEIEVLPAATVTEVVGLQAGVEGLQVRAGGEDETAFIVDGFTFRDERDNTPYTGISLAGIDEIQVQSGGFSAQYGNLRSGVVNVVNKEGALNKYDVKVIYRYSPAGNKHFGQSFNDKNAYWVRPYLDDDVAWTGTQNGAWDKWMQEQYPEFEGWNTISERTLADADPNNDLTPTAAQQLFLFQHRKKTDIQIADYDFDMGFGGPVPMAGDLGNLRFFTTYREQQEAYLLPLARDAYTNYNWSFKLTSDVGPGQKLLITTFLGGQEGVSRSRAGEPELFTASWQIASDLDRVSYTNARIFSTDYWNPSKRTYKGVGVKYTSSLSEKSYLDISFDVFDSEYKTGIFDSNLRNLDRKYLFGNNYYVDEAPYGFSYEPSTTGIDGSMRMSVGFSNARDTSKSTVYTLKGLYNNQLSRFHNIKTGFEFALTESQINYGLYDPFLSGSNYNIKWNKTPVRGAFFIEDLMEFEGMIANVGLRIDYFNAGGEWYKDYNPYDNIFTDYTTLDENLEKEPTKDIVTYSPRMGISFPVTEDSKIAFNYGHYYQIPIPENLYILRYDVSNAVDRIANPNKDFPRTVSYELIYEHNLFDQYLVRMAGYYKDLSDQPRLVNYNNNGRILSRYEPYSYEDIRGFEITLDKKLGTYFRGFVNYTYLVQSYGNFGQGTYYRNSVEQREAEASANNANQVRPLPRPYARANLTFLTPKQYGPEVAGVYPFENFILNILGNYKAGTYFTWLNSGSALDLGVQYNVQWTDYYNVNLKLSKTIDLGVADLELYMDVFNVFNFKLFSQYGFIDGEDYLAYMRSLHLPKGTKGMDLSLGYINVPGDDQPGDYRKKGVDYVPIVAVTDVNTVANPNVNDLYYESVSKRYLRYTGTEWRDEDKKKVNQILDDRAYIDMPNQKYLTFLNPRDIFFGVKLSFDF